MKTQMRFQKILMIVSLIVAALGVVYALVFSSGSIHQVIQIADKSTEGSMEFLDYIQYVNDTLLMLGVIFVIAAVLLFVAGNHNRRNYYITNYVATAIVVVYEVVFIVMLILLISSASASYNAVDLVDAEEVYYMLKLNDSFGEWSSPWTFAVGYVFMIVVLADAVFLVLNLIWKIKLMKGEKALLSQNAKEVA